MTLKQSLGVVIRLTREARKLEHEDFKQPDGRHLWNVENGRSGVTLETLENIAKALDVDLLALLATALSYERKHSPAELLKQLTSEMKALSQLGIIDALPSQFENGLPKPRSPGRKASQERIEAVLRCKAQGMTQKEASVALGVSKSTVGRIWHGALPGTE